MAGPEMPSSIAMLLDPAPLKTLSASIGLTPRGPLRDELRILRFCESDATEGSAQTDADTLPIFAFKI